MAKSFLQIPSSPNPLLSSAPAAAEENLSFSQTASFFFSQAEWSEETRVLAGEFEGLRWATGIEEHCICVFSLCVLDKNRNSF